MILCCILVALGCKVPGSFGQRQKIACAIDCGACGTANGTALQNSRMQAKRSGELGGREVCGRGAGRWSSVVCRRRWVVWVRSVVQIRNQSQDPRRVKVELL